MVGGYVSPKVLSVCDRMLRQSTIGQITSALSWMWKHVTIDTEKLDAILAKPNNSKIPAQPKSAIGPALQPL